MRSETRNRKFRKFEYFRSPVAHTVRIGKYTMSPRLFYGRIRYTTRLYYPFTFRSLKRNNRIRSYTNSNTIQYDYFTGTKTVPLSTTDHQLLGKLYNMTGHYFKIVTRSIDNVIQIKDTENKLCDDCIRHIYIDHFHRSTSECRRLNTLILSIPRIREKYKRI